MIYQSSRPAYQALKRKIIDGDMPFGAPITVKRLEAEIGFSAIPIREALIALAAEDLIDFFPGRGFFNKRLEVEGLVLRLDLLQHLLLACATALPNSRRPILRRRLFQDASKLRSVSESAFEYVSLMSDIFDTYFAHPIAILTRTAIAQCARYLLIDEQRHEADGSLAKAAFSYLWQASSSGPVSVAEGLKAFFDVRKVRIDETIEAAKQRDLLSGPSIFSSAAFDSATTRTTEI